MAKFKVGDVIQHNTIDGFNLERITRVTEETYWYIFVNNRFDKYIHICFIEMTDLKYKLSEDYILNQKLREL